MQTKKLFLLVPFMALSLPSFGQKPPTELSTFSVDESAVVVPEVGHYIRERHKSPDEYKNIDADDGISKARESIMALKLLRSTYNSGRGYHRNYLEVAEQEFDALMPYINNYLDKFTIGEMKVEKEVCLDFDDAYSSNFRSASLEQINQIYQNNLDDFNNSQQAGHNQFLTEISADFGSDVAAQLEFFMDKFAATSSSTTVSNASIFGGLDGSSVRYFQSLCNSATALTTLGGGDYRN